ncbi:MAG: alcohol dehydrogenase catalytic domain-containing protein [Ilumatobacteraceae bacterium]
MPDPEVGDGQLLVQVACAGLQLHRDTYHRGGLYPMSMPFTPGMEGRGTVVAVGSGVSILAGTRVAWPSVMGAYAERAVVPADRVVVVPDGVPFPIAVTLMVQG